MRSRYAFFAFSLILACHSGEDRVTTGILHRADSLYAADRYAEAIPLYDQVISATSASGETYYRRGYCLHEVRRCDRAIGDFSMAIQKGFKVQSAHQMLSLCYLWLGEDSLSDLHLDLSR
jgi:hypothetical protein